MNVVQIPWAETVLADGHEAIVSLLSGAARLGPLSAAQPEDAAAALLHGHAADDPLSAAFDKGCLDALTELRDGISNLEDVAYDAALSRLGSLVNIIRRVKPRQTVVDLHKSYVTWNAFFEGFVLDRGFDLRREYFRILALTQDAAADAGLPSRRLMPLWLAVCGESGGSGRYDDSYLRVALAGLRGLPLGEAFSSNEDFALHGLARWAAARNPSKKDFLREWHLLEGDFPRTPDFWAPRVATAIEAMEREIAERTQHKRETFPAAAWWREDAEVVAGRRNGGATHEPPPRERLEEVLRCIGDPFASFEARLDQLMRGHRRYADSTGDVFYLVRTACNVGMKLIKRPPAAERTARGEMAVRLAKLAFEYDPTNVYAWALFRDGLETAGRLADAEVVGWETIRRFPENPQWRTQLAKLLAEHLARPQEAEALLQETVALFPDDATARTQLATVLAEHLGRPQEAEALLRETAALFPDDAYPRNQLATVLADDLGAADEARAVLEAAVRDGAADNATRSLLAKLRDGRRLRGHRRAARVAPAIEEPTLHLPAAAARRQLFLYENGLAGPDSIRELLRLAPTDAYLAYVGERTGVRPAAKTTFVLAFEEAASKGSAVALRALMARARPLQRALIGQAVAALEERTEDIDLNDNDSGGSDRVGALAAAFSAAHPPAPQQRVVLLRDMAASFLSTDTMALAA